MEPEVSGEEAAVEGDLYEVDKTLSPLQAVLQYCHSDLHPQRHAYIRGLGAVAKQAAACGDAEQRAGQLEQLASLASELLTSLSDEPDEEGLVLVLEQLPVLGDALASCHATTLSSTSQPSNTAAPLSHHLDTLITTCFTVLRSHNDTEDVTTPGATAYAQLVTKLPPNEIFTRIDTDVRRVLGGGAGAGAGEEPAQCELALRLLDQYVLCALGEEGVVRGRVTEGDWLGLVGYVGERVMESDVDQGAQQAFAKSVPTLSLLLSAAQRGAEFIAPACQSLAASPVWSVRAVLCDAIPLCVAAASIQDTNTLSPSTATTTTTATATAALSTLAIGPAKPATHTSHGSQARAAGVADTITRQGAADHPAGSEPDGSGDDVGVGTRTVLLELLCGRLAKDVSHWVRNAAIKAAGPTIAALNRLGVACPQALLDLYCQCQGGVRALPEDLLQQAATCFTDAVRASYPTQRPSSHTGSASPSATHTGPTPSTNTAHTTATAHTALVKVCVGLLNSGHARVITTVCSQLADILPFLGPDAVTQHVLPCLVALQSDNALSHVRQGLIPSAGRLIEVVPVEVVPRLLDCVLSAEGEVVGEGHEAQAELCGAWRQRLALAQQLLRLAASCQAAAPQLVAARLIPSALQLCADPVWAVRREAGWQLGAMLSQSTNSNQPLYSHHESILTAVLRLSGATQPPPPLTDPSKSVTALRVFTEACRGFLQGQAGLGLELGTGELDSACGVLGKSVDALQAALCVSCPDGEAWGRLAADTAAALTRACVEAASAPIRQPDHGAPAAAAASAGLQQPSAAQAAAASSSQPLATDAVGAAVQNGPSSVPPWRPYHQYGVQLPAWMQALPGLGPGQAPASGDELLSALRKVPSSQLLEAAELLQMLLHLSTTRGPMHTFLLDTETTGLRPSRALPADPSKQGYLHRIVELYVKDAATGEVFSTRIQPGGKGVPPEVTKIHHIDDAALTGAPSTQVASFAFMLWIWQRCEHMGGATVVIGAHNVRFDLQALAHTLFDARLSLPAWVGFCTVQLSKRVDKGEKLHNLKAVATRYGVPYNEREAHNAQYDVGLMDQVLQKMTARKWPGKSLNELVRNNFYLPAVEGGKPVEQPVQSSFVDTARYERHHIPEWGWEPDTDTMHTVRQLYDKVQKACEAHGWPPYQPAAPSHASAAGSAVPQSPSTQGPQQTAQALSGPSLSSAVQEQQDLSQIMAGLSSLHIDTSGAVKQQGAAQQAPPPQ